MSIICQKFLQHFLNKCVNKFKYTSEINMNTDTKLFLDIFFSASCDYNYTCNYYILVYTYAISALFKQQNFLNKVFYIYFK